MITASGYGNGTVEVDGMGEDAMERLKEICEKSGMSFAIEKYIVFGEGVYIDNDNKIVIVSHNAEITDINNAIEYITAEQKLTTF